MSSWQCRLKSYQLSLLQKEEWFQRLVGCYYFSCEIGVKIATFVYLYMLLCATLCV